MQEESIIALLSEGDEKAFKFIFDQNQKTVINICYRFIGVREEAEDVTQEVFLDVFRSIKSFRRDSKLSTWIYRIATTKSIDYLRSKRAKKRSLFLRDDSHNFTLNDKLSVPDAANPEKELIDEERKRVLIRALSTLPVNQRIAFTLSKYDELSYKEIAEIMETSLASVESLIHRAKKNLERKLYRYYKK